MTSKDTPAIAARSYASEFAEFGERIEREWHAASFHPGAFADIAERLIAEAPDVDVDDLLLKENARLGKDYKFSDYDLYIYANDRFRIEVLYWLSGRTSIHEHAFSGAFRVLSGRSLHVTYAFEKHHEVLPDLLVGDLRPGGSEVLSPGDVRRIDGGSRFIHATFHMVRPTVTLVVRTLNEVRLTPQLEYRYPHFARDPFCGRARRAQQEELVQFIARTGRFELLDRAFDRLWRDATLEETLQILELPVVRGNPERFERELGRARERHPEFAREITRTLDEDRRRAAAEVLRQRVVKADQKFFLALLINLHGRTDVLRHLEREFAPEAPAAVATRLLAALGERGHLPQVPAERLGELQRVLEGDVAPGDVPSLAPLLAHEALRPLFSVEGSAP